MGEEQTGNTSAKGNGSKQGNGSKHGSKHGDMTSQESSPSWVSAIAAANVADLQTHLAPFLADLRTKATAACPGRTAALIVSCTRKLLSLPTQNPLPADLTDAERMVVDMAEQFVLDVHSVSDEQFAGLRAHYQTPEILAMLFEMALNDGINKLEKVSLAGHG